MTRLVLAQRRWLCDTLASRGLTANSVIVADDDNLDIAAEYGFPTVERDNSDLGERFNAGYRYAAGQGADIFVHVGSDDWIHPDTFNVLAEIDLEYGPNREPDPGETIIWSVGPCLIAQRRLLIIDLGRQTANRCYVENHTGCIPWLIPRKAMAECRAPFSPIQKGLMRGIDGSLARGLPSRINWVFQDAPDEWCVDFKTETNLTPYRGLATALGNGSTEDPWELLRDFYPAELVEQAKALA